LDDPFSLKYKQVVDDISRATTAVSFDQELVQAVQMTMGLTGEEELSLAAAENKRYRAALEIAIRGLSAARERGFQEASGVIADVNSALAQRQLPPASEPLWPLLASWAKRLRASAAPPDRS
jgi:hypothetical protein